ncbi:MAG TPA: glycosyltransferase family A protein [Pyrinomonadaceae bacterium]
MSSARTISVIIPTYNYGRFVSEAITSALRQTYEPSEIVVVDDGSTDGTAEIVQGFGERVRYLRQERAGVCAARNLGVANTTGHYIAFLDADDIWEPIKLEKQIQKFEADPEVGLVHCGMREFDSATGETLQFHLEGDEGWVAQMHLLFERPVINASGSSIVVTRTAFDQVEGFDTRLRNGEDWEFCYRVAKEFKVGYAREPLVQYRNHGVNATKNISEMERSSLIAWRKIFDTDDDTVLVIKRRSYGNLHKVLAGSYLHNRQIGGFLRNLVKSLWYRPSYLAHYPRLLVRRRKN